MLCWVDRSEVRWGWLKVLNIKPYVITRASIRKSPMSHDVLCIKYTKKYRYSTLVFVASRARRDHSSTQWEEISTVDVHTFLSAFYHLPNLHLVIFVLIRLICPQESLWKNIRQTIDWRLQLWEEHPNHLLSKDIWFLRYIIFLSNLPGDLWIGSACLHQTGLLPPILYAS